MVEELTDQPLVELAQWDTAYINDLPDSAFLYIEPGGEKDDEGKTVPRDLRHFPYKDSSGSIDMPHLRNALARIPQSSLSQAIKDRVTARARALLDSANQQSDEEPAVADGSLRTLDISGEVTLSVNQRRLGLNIVPYNVVAESRYGLLMFEKGAFGEVDPKHVRLRMDHENPPTGKGDSFTDTDHFAHMEFLVSKTQRGDEQLTLAHDGVSRGASVGFREKPNATRTVTRDGRRVTVYPPNSAVLEEVSTTWSPTFAQAGVTYMLSTEKENEPVSQEAPETTPVYQMTAPPEMRQLDDRIEKALTAFDEWREQMRRNIAAPPQVEKRRPKLYNWLEMSLRMQRGQAVSPTVLKELDLEDSITSDNPGLVPDTLVRDFDDLITGARPFVNSLREVTNPTGMSLILPLLLQRATVGTQSAQKAVIVGGDAPQVGTVTFAGTEVFAGADVAYQLIQRGDGSFFDLLTQELGEATGLAADKAAIDALLNPNATVSDNSSLASPVDGGELDPEAPTFGQTFTNSMLAYRRPPDTIWMNTAAIAAFIDAQNPAANGPLYAQLTANIQAGGGQMGSISGLRVLHVPALDEEEIDVIVGPSRSYVYAADPALRLQADVPSRLGRDIVLYENYFFGPRYPDAFTTFTVASS